ncbi:MAG: SDR family oxidoreductase [Porticoccaceae bacterium]
MAKLLEGKKALITGAGRGLGAAIAVAFAREGADVALAARSRNELEEVAAQVEKHGVRAAVLPVDLRDRQQVEKLADDALSVFGGLDIFMNNAAMESTLRPFLDIPEDEWDSTQEINFGAAIILLRRIGARFVEQKSGNVIIMSSIRGTSGVPMGSGYATTKAALNSITKSLAVEWGPAGVRVNGILPGPVLTPGVRAALEDNPALLEYFGNIAPLKGWNMPDKVADTAVFLASDMSRAITGHLLVTDQGLTAILQDAFTMVSTEAMQAAAAPGDG